MKKRKLFKTPREVSRRPVGVHVSVEKSGPLAYRLYEVVYDTGREYETRIEKGNYIHCWPGIRPAVMTAKEKAHEARFTRPDIDRYIRAATILLEPVLVACEQADAPPPPKGPKKGKKRGK
jgi:hypothetical protein